MCAVACLIATQPLRAQTADETPLDLDALDKSVNWSVLDYDAASLLDIGPRRKTITIVPMPRESAPTWNRTDRRDGSAAITVNRSLPAAWDTKVGVDFGLPAMPSPLMRPDRLLAATSTDRSSGVAWARTTAPALDLPLGWDNASIDARFDPAQDQSQLGTRFRRSVPLGADLSITMESGFAITHLRAQPLPSELGGSHNVSIVDTDRLAKLNFLATGTSLGAGSRKSSADDVWLNSFSAEQRLFGGISVTGTVSETLEGSADKSLTAGFRRNW